MVSPEIRPATPADAASMAVLVDIAGYGLPAWIWSAAVARGDASSVLEVGRSRALREQGSFSYRNAFIAELDGNVAGMLTGYRQPDTMTIDDLAEVDPVLRPLFALEALAPGTWYVNVLATFAEYRSKGVGAALLAQAETLARQTNASGLSVIFEDDNLGGRQLYERTGFKEVASRPFVAFPGCRPAHAWILMAKTLAT